MIRRQPLDFLSLSSDLNATSESSEQQLTPSGKTSCYRLIDGGTEGEEVCVMLEGSELFLGGVSEKLLLEMLQTRCVEPVESGETQRVASGTVLASK